MKWKIFSLLLALGILVSGAYMTLGTEDMTAGDGVDEYAVATVDIGGVSYYLDVADTDAKRSRGLSGRSSQEENAGMLFIFDTPGPGGIWMKDMNYSIDILWLDETYHVIHMVEGAAPESYPAVFTPPQPAQYVIELSAGAISENNVKVGDFVNFDT